ncbi:MAG TPA: hypothetical protein PLV83_05865, partial [Bacilli bacterium]|nr:hypothetical protein [Bacilli bacterium]
EYIEVDLDNPKHKKYIDNNKCLQNKKIVPSKVITESDIKTINKFAMNYSEYINNLYLLMSNNSDFVSYYDCIETIKTIKSIGDKINELDLSPLEKVMYAYDMVRRKIYKQENNNEDLKESRDLTNVILGDKIVCAGFAHLFNSILNYVGVNCKSTIIVDKENEDLAHERNVIYIKDSKYRINGVYYFDPTWDSKRSIDNDNYLKKYRFFCKTIGEIQELEKYKYDYCDLEYSDELYVDLIKCIEEGNFNDLFFKYRKTINYMVSTLKEQSVLTSIFNPQFFVKESPLYGKIPDKSKKALLLQIKRVCNKFNKPIEAEKMLELVNNVRKVEYLEDSDLYNYSLDELFEIYINSKWKFKENYYTKEERLALILFGENEKVSKVNEFLNYIRTTNIYDDIKETKETEKPKVKKL